MAFYEQLTPDIEKFIENQKLFFVGTAGNTSSINISPKGMDSFRVISPDEVVWMNLTGSGNETAAHVLENGRITIMFCAFEGKPNILRIYGKARSIHPQDQEWNQWNQLFPNYISARQILVVSIKRVQTSCGFGVPLYEYKGQRDQLKKWAEVKGTDGVQEYKEQHNLESIDGLDTGIFFKDE